MSIIIKGGNSSDLAAVKPASTAPLATDPALVVTMSPNSPASSVTIAAGSAVIGHVILDAGSTTVVSGSVTVAQPTGTNLHTVIDSGTTTVTQATGANLHTVVDSGTIALSAGSAVIGHVINDTGSTTAVTGNVTVVQPTGTNLHVVIDSLPADADALAQGSTTSGQLGPLVMGAVTTAAPGYTTAQTSPLSLTTTGLLRVDGSGVTQPVSAVALTNGTQKTQIIDASGNVISSLLDGNGGFTLEVAQAATLFVFSAGNSSTAQLAAAATFTGTIDNVINQQDYSVIMTSDQNGTLTLKQYIDAAGTRLVQTQVFSILAGVGFARSGVMNGNYFQLTFTNNGGSTTTTLNINTYYGTITPSTALNNEPMSLNEVNGTALSLGQTTMAASLPVTIASNQGNLPVSQATASALNAQVQGPAASGAAKSGNPVQVGGVFNTTQPTVTTGQMVESQYTARGAAIVATGTDAFNITNITGTVSLPTGASTAANQTSTVGSLGAGTSATNSQLSGNVFTATLPTLTNGQQLASQADVNGRLIVNATPVDGAKTTYSAAATGIVPAAAATDIFTITGSASKTIRVLKVSISATQTTAGENAVILLKRSTANTAGTSAAVTAVPHDSSNAAATGTVLSYTANPTAGTLVGNLRSRKIAFQGATGTTSDEAVFDFGNRPGQAIVLRGTAQVLAINLTGATITGGSVNMYVEWTEES